MSDPVFTIDDLTVLALHHELMGRNLVEAAAELNDSPALLRLATKYSALAGLYRRIGERIQEEERKKDMMKPTGLAGLAILLVIVALLLGGVAVMAQETPPPPSPQAGREINSTPALPVNGAGVNVGGEVVIQPVETPPQPSPQAGRELGATEAGIEGGLSRVEIIVVGVLFALTALLSVFSVAFVAFARQLLNAAPPWVGDLLRDNAQRGFDRLQDYARTTPNTIDDDLAERLRQMMLTTLEDVLVAKPTPNAARDKPVDIISAEG